MKPIFALGLILTFLARTEGQKWAINVTRNIYATLGSNVTIRCSFSSPLDLNTANVKVFWKKNVSTYVFHANDTYVLEMYRGKTKLLGKKKQGNCSLMIQNIREEDHHIYLRVNVNGEEYSFKKDFVRITLSVASQQWTIIIICVAVLVPVVLLAILLAGGICLRLKRKSKDTSPKRENKMFSDEQEINDPIYINFGAKVSPECMAQRTAHDESIYENVTNPMLAGCCS